jgi:hypothetical protein
MWHIASKSPGGRSWQSLLPSRNQFNPVISVPTQGEMSFVGGEAFWRAGDETKKATEPIKIAELAVRFR